MVKKKNFNKMIIVIILTILLIISSIGYSIFFKHPTVNSVGAVPCSNEYYEAINKSDVTICELVTNLESENNYCRDNCIKEIAYKKGEPELCKLINSDTNYNLTEKDLPEVLVPIKDFCYIHLAEKLNDISLCNKVESDWAKTNCLI